MRNLERASKRITFGRLLVLWSWLGWRSFFAGFFAGRRSFFRSGFFTE